MRRLLLNYILLLVSSWSTSGGYEVPHCRRRIDRSLMTIESVFLSYKQALPWRGFSVLSILLLFTPVSSRDSRLSQSFSIDHIIRDVALDWFPSGHWPRPDYAGIYAASPPSKVPSESVRL